MVRKLHALLAMMFKQAVLWGDIEQTPIQGIMLPRVAAVESRAFTADEAKRFVYASRSDIAYLIFEFGLVTGLRPQELVAVRWKDIDLAKRTVSVKQAAAFSRSGASSMKEPKTAKSVRTVSFTKEVAMRLLEHRESLDAEMADLKALIARPVKLRDEGVAYERRLAIRANHKARLDAFRKNDLVFPNADGQVWRLNNLNRRLFKEVLKLAKLDSGFAIKSLRHTNASMLAERLSPRKLQVHLGHSDIKTSLRFYVHVHEESRHESADRIGEMLY